MIEIPRVISRFGASGIFRRVSGLNADNRVAGYLEQWCFGGSPSQVQGFAIDDIEKLDYAELVAKCYGIYFGDFCPYGPVLEKKFYQINSFLVNGSIVTAGYKREFFGTKIGEKPTLPQFTIKVSETMPERLVKITAETVDRLRETAQMVKLPLEALVSA